ncbi:MAG: cytochrome P450 [Pseudomonadota bacterium]
MADTLTAAHPALERPRVTEREKSLDTHYDFDAEIPPASEIDLDTVDFVDPELWRQEAYWDRFARLRAEDPVHYTADSVVGPYWSITSYDDIMAVDTNHHDFSSSWEHGGITLQDMDEDFQLPMFIAMDPPKHDIQRKTVQPAVSPPNLKLFEPLIRERTQTLLDSLPVGEPFDWVDLVSIELTTMMLATLFDFPFDDRRKLTRWSDVVTGRDNPDICPGGEDQWRMEMMECLAYFQGLWADRLDKPKSNDLVSLLVHGDATKNMPPMEFLGNTILLIVGGNDTTRNSMTGSVYALNKFADQFEILQAKPELIPNMVSEAIRWQTPLAHMRRTAVRDVELGGKTIRKGDRVAMWYVSGNRDETKFERPNDFWIERPRVRSHLSFGFGIHRCVGNRLGELQLRILWEELLARFDRIEVMDEPSLTPNSFVKGYTWMPVILHAK